MYSSEDLVWTKNVKRDGGTGWAYQEVEIGNPFYLHFSPKFRASTSHAKPGEIIMLFQTIQGLPGFVKGTYLTHLITPLDNKVINDFTLAYPHMRLMGAIAKPERPILKPDQYNFFKPNRGALCSLDLIEPFYGTATLADKQKFFWRLFGNINNNLDNEFKINDEESDPPDYEIGYAEGATLFVLKRHKHYERNVEVIKKAKEKAKAEGRFHCEACSFNFESTYPKLGDSFIECHHQTPIASGGIRTTYISDLALVCSNCHRMLHRKLDGKFLTVEELKEKFFSI